VVLVPSVRDATAAAAFPQPPLLDPSAIETPASARVTAVANPGSFAVNGITFHVCTQDVLRHLSASEAAREGGGGVHDRMTRLAQHLPGQQSAYPLFPPNKTACLDASLAAHLTLDVTPDVLLLPSDLNPFAKVVPRAPEYAAATSAPALPAAAATSSAEFEDSFVAINPGRIAKGNAGGGFALVRIAEGALAGGNGTHAHNVGARARVDIVRV
jgi:DNA polymerase alpha subunit B